MKGRLNLVSVGPGFIEQVTPAAERALKGSDTIVGYDLYLQWIAPWIVDKEKLTTPLTRERERALLALSLARQGKEVSLVSSGDIGVYAMASLAFDEMQEDDRFDVQVLPGVTAANACASILGAPLSHDFATLSLSDLLCPWQWIEDRARHIAQSDLCVALYNVQSMQRQEGIFRILDIMLAWKRPETVCGVVRNAYRPEQKAEICELSELPGRQFDMLTTIVIGNRFTRRKRNWMFTPRGYNNWDDKEAQAKPDSTCGKTLPEGAVWVFAGTRDGNELANKIAARGDTVVVSTATAYGGALAESDCPQAHVLSGKIGALQRRQKLSASRAKAIVDATHPYASRISRQLVDLGSDLAIPYVRFDRPSLYEPDDGILVSSVEEAARQAASLGQRIFLATGSREIKPFLTSDNTGACWFVRVTPELESLQAVLEAGVPPERICAMQGPFSRQMNEALWRQWQIDCLVTKDSGDAGGYREKIDAAKLLGIPVIVIGRPQLNYPQSFSDSSCIMQWLETLEIK